jgi:hypothetical protein
MEHGQERRRMMSVRSEVGLIMDAVEDKAACSTLAFELILSLHARSKGVRENKAKSDLPDDYFNPPAPPNPNIF